MMEYDINRFEFVKTQKKKKKKKKKKKQIHHQGSK